MFYDRVLEHTEAGAAAAGDAIVTFEGAAVLYPRGRFDIEMYATFLKLLGQARILPSCVWRNAGSLLLIKSKLPGVLLRKSRGVARQEPHLR